MPPGGGDSPSSGATITSVFFLMTIFGIWLAVAHAIYTRISSYQERPSPTAFA